MPDYPPITPDAVQALKDHYAAIEEIQKTHGIGPKGSVQTWYPYADDKLVVEADGLGGGCLMLVDDHYPFDGFMLKHSQDFENEHEACKAAEWFDDLLENSDSCMSATEFFERVGKALLTEGPKFWHDEPDEEGPVRQIESD
jgi:hypothetical protein